jgi:predicted RNA binding protein YcfA (HicA-like mRNA interferase family)
LRTFEDAVTKRNWGLAASILQYKIKILKECTPNKPKRKQAMPRSKKVREMIQIVEADGWYLARTTGSHRQYHHLVKRGTVTIPGKPSDILQPKMVRSIYRQAEIDEE